MITGGVLAIAVPGASAAGTHQPGAAHPAGAIHSSKHALVASGVREWSESMTMLHRPEKLDLMSVDLTDKHVSLDAVTPGNLLGYERRNVLYMAKTTHAVGGINADWFDLTVDQAMPRGALIRHGDVMKTPRPDWQANLSIGSDGKADIGAIPFVGNVTRLARSGKGQHTTPATRARHHRIYSINTPIDAANGRITYLTHDLVGLGLRRPCTVVQGRTLKSGTRVVTSVRSHVTSMGRVPTGQWALASCGEHEPTHWLRDTFTVGDKADIALRFPQGKPRLAVSGGRVLVEHGKAYDDKHGQKLYGLNPETFACVNKTGTSLLLGVVDGRTHISWGVDYPTLTSMMKKLGCWTGMTLDGGGSTTMVAKLPGHPLAILNNPSDGIPRPVADGLYVYSR